MSLFHAGDLHSGISQALQNSLPVVIFVRDDGAKSQEWEESWLGDETIHNLLSDSVVLRIQAGSQEEEFLTSFCKWTSPPSIFVIRDGRTSLSIGPEVTRQDFEDQLKTIFNAPEPNTQSEPYSSTVNTPATDALTEQPSSTSVSPTPATLITTSTTTTQNTSIPASPLAPPSTSTTVIQDAPPSPPRTSSSKAKGKGKAISSNQTSTAPPPKTASQMDWLEKQRQRKLEARAERERIMASIEADKAERRAEQQRKRQARSQASTSNTSETPTSPFPYPSQTQAQSEAGRGSAQMQDARLSVKLIDGSTIRATFPSTATVAEHVRSWVVEASPELRSMAYMFKQILAPAPARGIEVGEERLTLKELGLTPSATLVLLPVAKPVSEAYGDSAGGMAGSLLSLPWSVASGAYGVASSIIGGVAGAVGGILGYGSGAVDREESADIDPSRNQASERDGASGRNKEQVRSSGRSSGIRVRTLADQRAEGRDESNRWYNGNQLNFQPNEDIDEE